MVAGKATIARLCIEQLLQPRQDHRGDARRVAEAQVEVARDVGQAVAVVDEHRAGALAAPADDQT